MQPFGLRPVSHGVKPITERKRKPMTRRWAVLVLALLPAPAGLTAQSRLDVTLETDEAEAVLAILDARAGGQTVSDEQWSRLFASEGYRRLKEREAAMQVPFTDDEFRAFVLSESLLERRAALRNTLDAWTRRDPGAAARRAFRYLPDGSVIRATVYPAIKPRPNSFVYDLDDDPAIFLYLDPAVPAPKFENTVAHELHHVGFSGACRDDPEDRPERVRTAREWMSGFGEGVAMLAAAGSPAAHPHATSNAEERAVWERDVARVPADMEQITSFFTDILEGRLYDPDERRRRGFELINSEGVPQGPFYTVGWHVASTIERVLGREVLVGTLCEPAVVLAAYNRAARQLDEGLALWPEKLIERLR